MAPEQWPPFWIPLPGFVAAMALLIPAILRPNPIYLLGFQLAGVALAVLCVGGIVGSLLRWKAARVLTAAVLGLYWVAMGAIFFLFLWNPIFVVLYMGVFIVPALLIVCLCTVYARRGLKPSWRVGSAVAGFICGLLALSISQGLALDKKRWHGMDATPLAQDMVTINKCAHQFAALHPETGYPQSLRELGPQGSGCLSGDLMKGEYKGFSLAYQPGEKDSSGKVTTYVVIAEQSRPHGSEFSTMSTDESGVVLSSEHGPNAKTLPHLHSRVSGDIYILLADCLHGEASHKMDDAEAAEQAFQKCAKGLYQYVAGYRSLTSPWSRITYSFERNAAGAVEEFTAEVRPVEYGGIGGIRSYLIQQKFGDRPAPLKMYGTAEDRPATTSDPLANVCEMQAWPAYCEHLAERVNPDAAGSGAGDGHH